MLATQDAIETLAERIERAYRLRRSCWYRGCSSARVWASAAATLLQLHRDDPRFPLDPELYVAVQPDNTPIADPWAELVQASSAQRYRSRIRMMIRGLHSELRGEVSLAEKRIGKGEAIGKVLSTGGRRLSPMGRYVVARRAGCDKLAERFRVGAVAQHLSCPLYRLAIASLLSPEQYPVGELTTGEELSAPVRERLPQTSLN